MTTALSGTDATTELKGFPCWRCLYRHMPRPTGHPGLQDTSRSYRRILLRRSPIRLPLIDIAMILLARVGRETARWSDLVQDLLATAAQGHNAATRNEVVEIPHLSSMLDSDDVDRFPRAPPNDAESVTQMWSRGKRAAATISDTPYPLRCIQSGCISSK